MICCSDWFIPDPIIPEDNLNIFSSATSSFASFAPLDMSV